MEDLEYLKTEYDSLVLEKDELIKTLNLVSKVAHTNSSSIECNSLTFVPDWSTKTLTLTVTNDLTYFKNKIELLGEESHALRDVFSIKIETLNKIKNTLRNKILIYKKDSEYYIRLMDGDLLIYALVPNITRLAFTSSVKELIYETNVAEFTRILKNYSSMSDEYSDKWLSFDTEKISMCGINFYSETKLNTPMMCMLMSDIELLIKLEQYYSLETLKIFSTDSSGAVPKLQIHVGHIEIEILNVISSMNKSTIDKLSQFILEPTYSVQSEALKRIIDLAISLPDIEKDLRIKSENDSLKIILKGSKGVSEFNLKTQKIGDNSTLKEVLLSVITLNKIINSIDSNSIELTLDKIYTTISSSDLRAIILNK